MRGPLRRLRPRELRLPGVHAAEGGATSPGGPKVEDGCQHGPHGHGLGSGHVEGGGGGADAVPGGGRAGLVLRLSKENVNNDTPLA